MTEQEKTAAIQQNPDPRLAIPGEHKLVPEGKKIEEPSEVDKLRTEMMGLLKGVSAQNEALAEQNADLRAQLKIAIQTASHVQSRGLEKIPELPEFLSEGQEVTYINHAGRPEHGKVIDISKVTGTVTLEIHGKHENDVQRVTDVKFGDKGTRNSFTLAEPPAKPEKSLPRAHPKGLQTPGL